MRFNLFPAANDWYFSRAPCPSPGVPGEPRITDTLFLNFCHHKAVELPRDANDKEVDKISELVSSFSGYAIPMSIGPRRVVADNKGMCEYNIFADTSRCVQGNPSLAIDVLLNPLVVNATLKGGKSFKAQVLYSCCRVIPSPTHCHSWSLSVWNGWSKSTN